jgi:hypothetical protein
MPGIFQPYKGGKMSIIDIAVIFSSFFTGASVIFAIYSYSKKNNQERFTNFRISLTDLRKALDELIDMLSFGGFTEIGFSVSNEIKKLFKENPSKDEIISYIKNPKNESYISQAITLGLLNSEFLQYSEEVIRIFDRKPVEYRVQFPQLSNVINIINIFLQTSLRVPNSVDTISKMVFYIEDSDRRIIDTLEEIEDEISIFREIAIWVSSSIFNIHEEVTKNILEELSNIIYTVTDVFINSNDRQLIKISKTEFKDIHKINLDEFENRPLDALVKMLYTYKSKIDLKSWDSLIESKTKITSKIEKPESEE